MQVTLAVAAIYNGLWGAWVILWPNAIFNWLGMPLPRYSMIWQCVGMIVAAYAIGYAIAAVDPIRWWPLVLVGLIGKVAGPIGFVQTALAGELPWAFGWVIVTNDLIWWGPFAAILWAAWQAHRERPTQRAKASESTSEPLPTAFHTACDQYGQTGATLLERSRLMVVLLRHAGCTFCRQTLSDLAKQREAIEKQGLRLVLVHMSRADDPKTQSFFDHYGLGDVSRISDPDQRLYEAFQLQRGTLGQLFGPAVWRAGAHALREGHGVGKLAGDGFQMPGAFVVDHHQVQAAYRHANAADRPDYQALAQIEMPEATCPSTTPPAAQPG
jgi:hypothetical protein